MLNRWLGIITVAAMLVANGAIIYRDVVPDWLAGEAPPSAALQLQPGERRYTQVGIYDARGRLLGRSWTHCWRTDPGFVVKVLTSTVLGPIALPQGLATPPVHIKTELTYRQDDHRVDDLDFRIFGLGLPISLRAEAMPSGEFPGTWQVGPRRGSFVLDSRAPAALGDVIRPFDRLPNLYVGRSWRLDLLDPLAQILPGLKAGGLDLEPVLIRVSGKEVIEHQGARIEAFVVEGAGATAWATSDGRVLRQVVNVPLLGELTLRDEPYDEDARITALRSVPTDSRLETPPDGGGP